MTNIYPANFRDTSSQDSVRQCPACLVGRLRHSRWEKPRATPAMMELQESRKQKKRAKRAEQTQLYADTKQEKRILKDKESIGDPAADAQGSQKIKQA